MGAGARPATGAGPNTHAGPPAALGGVDAGGQNVHVAEPAAGLSRRRDDVTGYTPRRLLAETAGVAGRDLIYAGSHDHGVHPDAPILDRSGGGAVGVVVEREPHRLTVGVDGTGGAQ